MVRFRDVAKRLLPSLLLLFCAASACWAADALILIRHDRAGPNLPTADFLHPDWLLWPAVQLPNSENGLLSIETDLDWEGQPEDLAFGSVGRQTWQSLNRDSLKARGYLEARRSYLRGDEPRLVSSPGGVVSPESLLLCQGNLPTIQASSSVPKKSAWLVYEALDWDGAASISRKCGGRALVVEYPPQPGTLWTRFWRFGNGWPDSASSPVESDLRVPGLVRMRSAYRLLRHPEQFSWAANPISTWGGANRWLRHDFRTSPWIGAGLFLVAFLVGALGLYAVANERTDPFVRFLIFGVLVFPASDELAMNVAFRVGLTSWPVLLVVCELGLLGIAAAVAVLVQRWRPEVPSSIGVFLVGAIVTTMLSPVWSDFSPSLRWPATAVSPELCAAWIGYLSGLWSIVSRWGKVYLAVGGAMALACIAISVQRDGAPRVALAVIPWAAGLGLCRGVFLVALICYPPSLAALAQGFVWEPYYLIPNLRETGGVNGAEWVRFGLSPGLLATIFATGTVALFSDRFVAYRLRSRLTENPRSAVVLSAATGMAALGVLNPVLLSGAVFLASGGALCVVAEAI